MKGSLIIIPYFESQVPGIGEATEKKLRDNGITTTFQLIAKYLSFKDDGVGPVEHADRFYFWLKSLGTPAGFRAGIVHSIAEKLNVTFVGIYDPDAYETGAGDGDEEA